MPLIVVGLNHKTAPVEVRERLAFADAAIPEALQQLRAAGLAEEAVIVSTCNRVEIYAVSQRDPAVAMRELRQFLLKTGHLSDPLDSAIYSHGEPSSLEHLFRVAAGLDSMVLGETEILGQVKKAYDLALRSRATGRQLNKVFQRAFNVAKHIRTETQIQRGSVSVASVAVDLAERIFETLGRCTVLVIGAGEMGEKAARALLSRGARAVRVTNRSFERAAALAAELGGRAVPFDDLDTELAQADIVISSTAAPGFVLDRARLEPPLAARKGQPLLLIDIAVPRDIDPAVNQLQGVFLYDIDDLQSIAEDARRQREKEIARCEAIIRERIQGLLSGPGARLESWQAAADSPAQ